MRGNQVSVIELVESPKEVDRLNRDLLELIDSEKEPTSSDENSALALKMANLISRRVFELLGVQRTIGVELEFISSMPRFTIHEVAGGCSTCV